MPLSSVSYPGTRQIKLSGHSTDPGANGRVDDDGRVKVKCHANTHHLTAYFEEFQDAFAERPLKRKHKKHTCPESALRADTPSLSIAIHIVGSRGDVQPFIPIAQLLIKKYGHRVRICTHPVFKDFVEKNGIDFFSIGGDPEALMSYMVKNPGLLPSRKSLKDGDVGKRKNDMAEIIHGAWRSCIEAGDGMTATPVRASNVEKMKDLFLVDAIIANPPSMAHIHCAEKLNVPLHMVFTMPWSPTKAFHHPLAAMNYGEAEQSTANYLSFMMMELLTWQGLGDIINDFRVNTLRLDAVSPLWGYQLLPRMRVPYTYLWSQALAPKPADWDSHIKITGFSFLEQASTYTPPQDLIDFLANGPTPIYIGFGSIVVDDPDALTELIKESLKIAGVRAVVSKGWGGIGKGDIPNNMYMIGSCPHDWLFKQVSAVVHHGGAGTTAAGIALGKPTVVVPFFGDQPFWGQMIAKAGAGPVPVPFKQMTAQSLAKSIMFALEPPVQVAVRKMAAIIAGENGAEDTANDWQERTEIDDFRCDLFPERLAIWQHKNGAQLSGMAISSLIQNHVIGSKQLKLIKRRHWYVDEGAEYPLLAIIATFTGFIRAVNNATTNYKRQLKQVPKRAPVDIEKQPDDGNSSVVEGPPEEWQPGKVDITQYQVQKLARRIARKTRRERVFDMIHEKFGANESRSVFDDEKSHGRFLDVAAATGLYTFELWLALIHTPEALMYNLANGFHNMPSYFLWSVPVRGRDEITGLGSGLRTAAKEFVMGHYDAWSGLVLHPYRGAKAEGAKGFGKGVATGGRGLLSNTAAALCGLPGYTFKGLEKEFAKRRLTRLHAELLLIRLRQSVEEYKAATEEERQEAVSRWKALHP